MKNKNKLIITNESDLKMTDVLTLVTAVIEDGRVSNNGNQYCYLTSFSLRESHYRVVTELNKHSDKFIVYNVNSEK